MCVARGDGAVDMAHDEFSGFAWSDIPAPGINEPDLVAAAGVTGDSVGCRCQRTQRWADLSHAVQARNANREPVAEGPELRNERDHDHRVQGVAPVVRPRFAVPQQLPDVQGHCELTIVAANVGPIGLLGKAIANHEALTSLYRGRQRYEPKCVRGRPGAVIA